MPLRILCKWIMVPINIARINEGYGKAKIIQAGGTPLDSQDSREDHLIFNRTVTLRDSWAKIEKAEHQRVNQLTGDQPR